MEITKQPSVEELKSKDILLHYIVRDIPPAEGLKRMTYYTSLRDRPGKIYFMRSYRRPIAKMSLNKMVENGQIIPLLTPIRMIYNQDVWLSETGEVFLLKGYNPWDDLKDAIPIAKPKELDPARIAVSKIKTKPKPYHEIPQ